MYLSICWTGDWQREEVRRRWKNERGGLRAALSNGAGPISNQTLRGRTADNELHPAEALGNHQNDVALDQVVRSAIICTETFYEAHPALKNIMAEMHASIEPQPLRPMCDDAKCCSR